MRALSSIAAFCAVQIFSVSAIAAPETYVVDASHTHVQFSVKRFGFNYIIGEFKDLSGSLTLDEDAPDTSTVSAEIKTESLESGDDVRNGHVMGEFWFDVANHPTITFISTGIELTGDDAAIITGDLTIKGVTKPVSLDAKLNRIGVDPASKRKAAGFSATANLSRSAFGMSIAEKLIGDDVAIRIELLAHQSE